MHVNRSYLYLFQTISGYGTTFILELNALSAYAKQKVGSTIKSCYIADVLYYKSKNKSIEIEDLEELLFFVFDPKGCKHEGKYVNPVTGLKYFTRFLEFVRGNTNYVDDYWVKEGHCIVFKVHKKFSHSYRKFLESKYSEMYTNEQIKELQYVLIRTEQGVKKLNYIAAVLLKNHEYGTQKLAKEIYQRFGEGTPLPDEPSEYDLPWLKSEEYFNYQFRDRKKKVIVETKEFVCTPIEDSEKETLNINNSNDGN